MQLFIIPHGFSFRCTCERLGVNVHPLHGVVILLFENQLDLVGAVGLRAERREETPDLKTVASDPKSKDTPGVLHLKEIKEISARLHMKVNKRANLINKYESIKLLLIKSQLRLGLQIHQIYPCNRSKSYNILNVLLLMQRYVYYSIPATLELEFYPQ